MEKLVIRGGKRLSGELPVSGSKNTALALMAAALLADGRSVIKNVPRLKDIKTLQQVIEVTGAKVDFDEEAGTLYVDTTELHHYEAPYELVKKMRASFYMLGAFLGRAGKARVSLPGGCAWGPRPVDLHIKGMQALGAEVDLDHGYVVASAKNGRLEGGRFKFEPSSVGATINVVLAAVKAKGSTLIENAAIEPDVVVFCEALKQMGAQIDGVGSRRLEIQGVDTLRPITLHNCADRIELGTFMITAAMVGEPGEPFRITGGRHEHLGDAFMDAFRKTGCETVVDEQEVMVTPPEKLKSVSIKTDVYPGFPTDLQAQWTVMLTQSEGNAKVVDTIYTDRFKHIPELTRMGARCIVLHEEVAIEGSCKLSGAPVMSTDLRASVSLVLAGLVAGGETHVLRIYHLDRGYERLETKLAQVGAQIWREQYDEFAVVA